MKDVLKGEYIPNNIVLKSDLDLFNKVYMYTKSFDNTLFIADDILKEVLINQKALICIVYNNYSDSPPQTEYMYLSSSMTYRDEDLNEKFNFVCIGNSHKIVYESTGGNANGTYFTGTLSEINNGSSGSGSSTMIVNITGSEGSYSADKTFDEINAYIDNGGIPVCRYYGQYYNLDYVYFDPYEASVYFRRVLIAGNVFCHTIIISSNGTVNRFESQYPELS